METLKNGVDKESILQSFSGVGFRVRRAKDSAFDLFGKNRR